MVRLVGLLGIALGLVAGCGFHLNPIGEGSDAGPLASGPVTTNTSCTATGVGCTCTASALSSGVGCSRNTLGAGTCCAKTGWPLDGTTCTCAPYTCIRQGMLCTCGIDMGGTEASCAGPLCCRTATDCECNLSGALGSCAAGSFPVTSCSAFDAPCHSGEFSVEQCSSAP